MDRADKRRVAPIGMARSGRANAIVRRLSYGICMAEMDKELELATMDALRGADNVRQRLLLEMNTGTPTINDLAYAVKVRVKEDFKIVEKVERKRRGDKPSYAVSNLRDLVGLRIVTLYRLDTLDILPILLERIEAGARNPDSVFSHRGIEEIIIYSTNPTGDAQDLPGRVRALCHAFDLSDRTGVEQTPQNYTSIHIVVWCRGKYRSAYRDIPVEIQVRTAFEDVWGEIDHSLKYKREDGPATLDKSDTARLELNEAHLNVMKTLIDGLAQYGDQIKLQMEGEKRIRATTSRRSEQAVDRLGNVDELDEGARRLAETVVADAQKALEGEDVPQATRQTARRRAAADLIRATEKLRAMRLSADHENEVLYVLEMERALLLFQIGNELGGAGGNATLVEASRIYSQMLELFPNRVVPRYRLARTLDELGDHHSSRGMYREAVSALPGSELSIDHWLRSAAPRLLGFSLWEDADRRLQAPQSAEDRKDALDELVQAIQLTQQALGAAGDDASENAKSRNNLLYFVLSFRMHGGEPAVLAELGLDDGRVQALLGELIDQADVDVARWDTIRALRDHMGDVPGAREAAETIVAALSDPQRRERWSTNDGIILRAAERTLEKPVQGGEKQVE